MKSREDRKGPSPLYYIYGEEDYLIEGALVDIKARALTRGFESLNYHVFEAKTMDAEEALQAARTVPAFSTMRFVVVNGADSLKANVAEKFLEYAEDPAPFTCLVFTAPTWKGVKGSKLYNRVSKKGTVLAFNRLSEGELRRWIKDETARMGKKIEGDAVEKLLAIAGGGLRDIKGELDKVVIFTGDREVVDAGCVESAGSEVRGETAFGLADAIGRRDSAEALRIFAKLSAEEPLKVLGAVTRQFRVLLKLKTLLKKRVEHAKLPSLVGVPFKYLKGYQASCSRFSEQDLVRAFSRLRGADLELKSSPLPGRLIMSRLIMELCSGRKV